jgi:hypothetical protein
VFLERAAMEDFLQNPRVEGFLQAFNTVYWWLTARFGLSLPTSTGNITRLSPLRSSTWSLHRCGFDGIILARGGKAGKFGNWAFSLGQHRLCTNVGKGFVATTSAWALAAVRKPLGSGFVCFSQLCDERSEFSKLALRSECGFGRVPPARAVTFSSVSSTDWVLL